MADQPATRLDDQGIVLGLVQKDQESLRMLTLVHGPKVYGFLRKYHPRVADEAFSQALWKVWRCADRFDPARASLGAWFLAIAQNAALDLRRQENRHTQRVMAYAEDYKPARAGCDDETDRTADLRELDQLRETANEILEQLPPLQRSIVRRDAEHPAGQVDAAQLAEELGSTASSVRANRSKAWKTIDSELGRRGYPPRRSQ